MEGMETDESGLGVNKRVPAFGHSLSFVIG